MVSMTRWAGRALCLLGAAALTGIVAACAPGDPPPRTLPAPPTAGQACAMAGQALGDGLLDDAEKAYLAVLRPQPAPSASTSGSGSPPASAEDRRCALDGVVAVRERRAQAAGAVAAGDHAYATGQYASARGWYEQAQGIDLDNKAAADGLTAVQRRTLGGDHPAVLTDRAGEVWRLALPFLCAILGMLLVARSLTGFSRPLPRRRWVRRGLLAAAAATGVAGACGIAWAVAGYAAPAGLAVLIGAIIACIGAAATLARRLGHRLGVSIEVRSADNSVDGGATAFLVGRLAVLGAHGPQGLRIPRGTDVVALPEDAVAAMPQGAVLQALLKLGWAVLRLSPWRLTVTLGSSQEATVEIAHNGRPVLTDVVWCRDIVPPHDEAADVQQTLLTGAAALLLITLGRSHPELREGLCGTTNWKSLTKQVLACEPPYSADGHVRTHMLAEAIDADPRNRLAWYAYLLALTGTEPVLVGGWRGVACRLDALYAQLPAASPANPDDGYAALRIRILYASAVGWLTHWEDETQTTADRADALSHAAVSVAAMNRAVDAAGRGAGAEDLAREAAPMAKAMAATIKAARHGAPGDTTSEPWLEPADQYLDDVMGKSLRTLYVVACGAARDGHRVKAFAALGLAAGLPFQRAGAPTDPAMRGLLSDPTFRQMVTGQPAIADLESIGPYAGRLGQQRLLVPGDLLARPPAADAGLATALGVTVDEVKRWRQLCRLAVTCPEPRHAVAWTNLLAGLGIGSVGALRQFFGIAASRRGAEPLLSAVAAAAQISPPTAENLESWAKPPAETPGPDA